MRNRNSFTSRKEIIPVYEGSPDTELDIILPSGRAATSTEIADMVAYLGLPPGTPLPPDLLSGITDTGIAAYLGLPLSPIPTQAEVRAQFFQRFCVAPTTFRSNDDRDRWIARNPWCVMTPPPFSITPCPTPPAFATPAERLAWMADPTNAGCPAPPLVPCPPTPTFATAAERTTWLEKVAALGYAGCTAPEVVLDSHVCPLPPPGADPATWYTAHAPCTPPGMVPMPQPQPAPTPASSGGMTATQGLLAGLGIAAVVYWASRPSASASASAHKRMNPRRR